MKRSTFLGSAVSVLLLFSVISYARTYIQQQDPKAVQQQQTQTAASVSTIETTPTVTDSTKSSAPAEAAKTIAPVTLRNETPSGSAVLPVTYTATAYSLRGRTASGKPVARGLIAADPRVLPLGTRVRIDAGDFSGEYIVADTGGAVRGRRIDIWTPTAREAMRFGRRAVKLTVLEFGGKRAGKGLVRPRLVAPVAATSTVTEQVTKPQK